MQKMYTFCILCVLIREGDGVYFAAIAKYYNFTLTSEKPIMSGADPGFDQGGGPQIVTGLKLPFWGLSFVEFWCWGLIFGGQGGGPGPQGPPLDPPLHVKSVRLRYSNKSPFSATVYQSQSVH